MITTLLLAIKIMFSPNGGCQQAAIDAINSAKSEIHLQAYSFTSAPIANALIAAQARGVKVSAILDAGANRKNKQSQRKALAASGAEVLCDFLHPIAHSKIVICDHDTVVTGSFNFSLQAERKNAENLLVISDSQVAEKYLVSWARHYSHAESCDK